MPTSRTPRRAPRARGADAPQLRGRHVAPPRRDAAGLGVLSRGAARGAAVPLVIAAVATASASGWTYRVQPGDSLSVLAQRSGTSVAELVRVNDLPAHGNYVRAGAVLQVPAPGGPAPAARAAGAGHAATHTVADGQTLWSIARRYGTTVAALSRANGLASSLIRPGQVLRLGTERAKEPGRKPSSANTFAGRTYPDHVVAAASANREALARRDLPSRERMRDIIAATARANGVDPALALAVSWQEAGWSQDKVSVANAIGAMQVIPGTGEWMSGIVGRELDLLDPQDNATAGVVLLKVLTRQASSAGQAVAGYYQGMASVRRDGLHSDTKAYVRNVLALRERFG